VRQKSPSIRIPIEKSLAQPYQPLRHPAGFPLFDSPATSNRSEKTLQRGFLIDD